MGACCHGDDLIALTINRRMAYKAGSQSDASSVALRSVA